MGQATRSPLDNPAARRVAQENPGHCPPNSAWAGRTASAAHDLEFPEVRFPGPHLLRAVGEQALRNLVRRHHELLKASDIGHMLSTDPVQFDAAVERLADFVIESCGGPANYTLRQGPGCMRSRHFPFTIDEAARETWLACLVRALDDSGIPQPLCEEYWNWMEPMSIRMVNRRTQKPQPARYPFNWFAARVRHPAMALCRR